MKSGEYIFATPFFAFVVGLGKTFVVFGLFLVASIQVVTRGNLQYFATIHPYGSTFMLMSQ